MCILTWTPYYMHKGKKEAVQTSILGHKVGDCTLEVGDTTMPWSVHEN